MSETKHTPRPWEWKPAENPYSDYYYLIGAGGVRVHSDGSAAGEYSPDIDVTGPDAQLIAAAPDLLEVLERALEHSNCPGDNCAIDWHAQARVVIAKAKGEAAS